MITKTVTGLELAWTLLALIGLGFVWALFKRSVDDYHYVKHAKVDGLRRYSVRTGILVFLGGVITQLTFVIVGAVAMTQPSIKSHITTANWITATMFMFSSVANATLGGIIHKRRVKLVKMIEEESGNSNNG